MGPAGRGDVDARLRVRVLAAGLSLTAAFLWASYYLFILAVRHQASPAAVLFYPFLTGGAAYVGWTVARGEGAALIRAFVEPAAYLRLALLLVTQLSLVAATYLAGAVDGALLSLLGDVVATPLVVATLFGEGRGVLGTRAFVGGLVLCVAGGTLAIVGGSHFTSIPLVAWPALFSLPVTVAFYFVLSAKGRSPTPVQVRAAQSILLGAVGVVALSPLLPGGPLSLLRLPPSALFLLAANGVVSFFVAYWLYLRAIGAVGLVLPPMLMTGIPVFTLLLSAVVLGIAPSPLALLGVPIAVAGGLVALRAESPVPAPPPATASP